jgi:hypothetical protein
MRPYWAGENPALKSHYQPLSVEHFCSGRSDSYLGKDWKSRQPQKLPYKDHKVI